jgi:wyosine [tRNA(Phe)-imidazoG37] synthetase (radical SAM superfamily)
MTDLAHHLRDPGDGADRPANAPLPLRYVYVARSRRSGGLSLGVDLTPQGHCSFSCVYCQASHPPLDNPELAVDTDRLRQELLAKLRTEAASELRDLVLAGSGEPTSVPNAAAALEAIRAACDEASFLLPRRIFTNGRHLAQPAVFEALLAWAAWGGELWVKLDAIRSGAFEAINGRRFDVPAHLAGIWRLAAATPIGVQTMLLRGPSQPDPAQTIADLGDAMAAALSDGAQIREVHLITLSRVPSDPHSATVLHPVEADELASFGRDLADRCGLPVRTFAAR